MITSLCLCEKEFFCANYWPLMENLLRQLSKLKSFSIEWIHVLLEVALYKESNETIQEKLQIVFGQLFPPKRITLTQNDCLDGLVDLICMVAKVKLDYVMQNIVFDLL